MSGKRRRIKEDQLRLVLQGIHRPNGQPTTLKTRLNATKSGGAFLIILRYRDTVSKCHGLPTISENINRNV